MVSVNYRLFPKCKCPDNIDDAAMAVAWVFDNIEKYGGNKEQIYVSGHSAGGYLTLMVALAKEYMAKYGQDADKIAKAYPMILISGDRDLEMLARYEENAHLQALPISRNSGKSIRNRNGFPMKRERWHTMVPRYSLCPRIS